MKFLYFSKRLLKIGIFFIMLFIFLRPAIQAQAVAIIGANHDSPDGFALMALEDIDASNSNKVFVTDYDYGAATNDFSNDFAFGFGESVQVSWTGIWTKGTVIRAVQTGENVWTVDVTPTTGPAGALVSTVSGGAWSLSNESLTAYSSSNTTNPEANVNEIYSWVSLTASPPTPSPNDDVDCPCYCNFMEVQFTTEDDHVNYLDAERTNTFSPATFAMTGNWDIAGTNMTLTLAEFTAIAACASSPELDVRNNADNADITDGSTAITLALGTDFGTVCMSNGSSSGTFRAENNGAGLLTFGADALAISNTTDFSITSDLTNNGTVAASGAETFTIQFDPASAGTKTCIVTISSDDPDENPYTFDIEGVGAADNTAGAASSTPTLCINTALTAITHSTTGATGIGAATGLPAGVTAAFAANTITISGTPTASGTFNYSIPLTGGCSTVSATGTITVTPDNTAGAASSTPTLCINTALTAITHTTTGATGVGTASGLPSGVTAAFATNTITISGTPTTTGTFNYNIPLTGGCGAVSVTGTITIHPSPVATVNDPSEDVGTTASVLTVTPTVGTPVNYTIAYDMAANTANFIDVTSASPISGAMFAIPAAAAANTYNGTITYIDANSCSGTDDFTVTLAVPSLPTVTVTVAPASADENSGTDLIYTFSRTGSTASALTVNFSISGSATYTTDYAISGQASYTDPSGTMTFGVGEATKTLTVTFVGDTDIESDETVIVSIDAG